MRETACPTAELVSRSTKSRSPFIMVDTVTNSYPLARSVETMTGMASAVWAAERCRTTMAPLCARLMMCSAIDEAERFSQSRGSMSQSTR